VAEAPRVVRADDPFREGGRVLAEALLAAGEGARLAIPGGSAAAAVRTARPELGDAWSRLRLTWVDERCVPFDDPESNRGSAYRGGYLDAGRPTDEEVPLFRDGEEPEDAVARVESSLERVFDGGLDVVLLGMGEDGHVASLFPGFEPPAEARAAFVPASPKPPPQRVTLTREILATARTTVLVAAGEAKRDALARLVRGDPAHPAHGLPGLVVVTDLDLGGSA